MMKTRTGLGVLGVFALGLVVGASGWSARNADAQGAEMGQDMGMALAAGLRETEGCLGVELGGFASGKQCIVAWFDSKQAAVRWYYSDTHQGAIGMFVTDDDAGTRPLAHVDDDVGPIMVIATLTPSDGQNVSGLNLPISQISIELYKPLPGGAFVNGRLAPTGFVVPHMRDLTGHVAGE